MAKNRYYTKEDEKILNEYIIEQRIKISTNKKQWFIESEKKLAEEYWEEYQRELFLKIQICWTYNGPMEFTD